MPLRGPESFVVGFSGVMDTLDAEQTLSPLAWQYVVERLLVEKFKFTVVSEHQRYPSLEDQYRLIRNYLESKDSRFDRLFINSIVEQISHYVIAVCVHREYIIFTYRKLAKGVA